MTTAVISETFSRISAPCRELLNVARKNKQRQTTAIRANMAQRAGGYGRGAAPARPADTRFAMDASLKIGLPEARLRRWSSPAHVSSSRPSQRMI